MGIMMTEKEFQLMERVAKQLNKSNMWVQTRPLNDIIEALLNKMENDMFDIEDMLVHLQNMKEVK
jgi:hypothetical protein